jgi:hypothetical protein
MLLTTLHSIQFSAQRGCEKCIVLYNGIETAFKNSVVEDSSVQIYDEIEVEIGLRPKGAVTVKALGLGLELFSERGLRNIFTPELMLISSR